jgi:4-hydroxy-3-polyprenylbenzoate decarboxylase
MKNQDLRNWVAELQAAGDIQMVSGAEREEEIGGIVDIYQRKMGRPALMFDDIPGYPKGYRVMANILTSPKRIIRTLRLPGESTEIDLVRHWRDYFREAKTIPPRTVNTGPVMENVYYDDDVDLLKIPTPRWHEGDGGYYIGTGCMVVMKDPDTGWINYGAYRVQSHDKNTASVMTSKGKHGNLIMRKYHDKGEPCPIAVVVGMHPALFMVAGLEIPYGTNEYDAAGGLIGEPVDIIAGPRTGLPIPAWAEIAFEGMVRLLRRRHEERAGHSGRELHAPQRSDLARRHPGGAAQRRYLLPRHLPLRRRLAPIGSRRRPGDQRRLGP